MMADEGKLCQSEKRRDAQNKKSKQTAKLPFIEDGFRCHSFKDRKMSLAKKQFEKMWQIIRKNYSIHKSKRNIYKRRSYQNVSILMEQLSHRHTNIFENICFNCAIAS